jgi:hypothetical protein
MEPTFHPNVAAYFCVDRIKYKCPRPDRQPANTAISLRWIERRIVGAISHRFKRRFSCRRTAASQPQFEFNQSMANKGYSILTIF